MTPTNSTLILEWTAAPEPGRKADEWPYPTEYAKYFISGGLADQIRTRLDMPTDTPVFLTQEKISGGWSEYTQENEYFHTIDCGEHHIKLGYSYWNGNNGLDSLIKWLDSPDQNP